MYGVVLVFVLVVMGGAIAYIGDKLGSKVGKKRLSVFGLRPKHTSIVVTIITGVLITSLTLGILALTSENVRLALFGMEKLNQQIAATEYNLKDITNKLEQAKKERSETLAALTKAQADYEIALVDLTKSKAQVDFLENTKITLENQKQELDNKVASLSGERTQLENDINRLNTLTKQLSEGIQFVREGDILYRSGEVIASTVLPYQADNKNVNEQLIKVFSIANQNILDRLNIKEKIEAIWIAKNEFEAAANYVGNSHEDMIVRIVAAGNIVYGEPVRSHIELFPNKKIYEEGQLIHSNIFSLTGKNGAEAEQIVLAFLKEVNVSAIKKGIIPDPLQGSVGVMNGAQFYEIVKKIEPEQGKVRLTALAFEDTNAIGPLRLKIEVERVQ